MANIPIIFGAHIDGEFGGEILLAPYSRQKKDVLD